MLQALCDCLNPCEMDLPLSNIGASAGTLKASHHPPRPQSGGSRLFDAKGLCCCCCFFFGSVQVRVLYTPTHLEYIFAIGGNLEHWESSGGLVERFNPRQKAWDPVSPMPSDRSDAAAANLEGQIYVVGGSDPIPSSRVDRYDPRNDRWHTVSPLSMCRSGCAAVCCGGYIYAIGGAVDVYGKVTNSVERYDPVGDSWAAMSPMRATELRKGCCGVQCGGSIYVLGGESMPIKGVKGVQCDQHWLADGGRSARREQQRQRRRSCFRD